MSAEKAKEKQDIEESKAEATEEASEETAAVTVEKGKIIVGLGIPIKFNDVEIKEVSLDFNSLTGNDICEAESMFLSRFFTPVMNVKYSKAYQAAIVAKASQLPYEAILELKAKDFDNVTSAAGGFLEV